jgi:hypothetical protein
MKITFKNKCNIPLFVIPTCSESFFKDMIYKERFPTSGNDASINGYTFNIINQSLSTKIRMKDIFSRGLLKTDEWPIILKLEEATC